jgi:hydroxymethylpyrimidine pyrophosphatase-like HAD family hydrolase
VNLAMLMSMKTYKHLFFDMDQTIAPARQPILPEMFEYLSSLPQDIIVVSGSSNELAI